MEQLVSHDFIDIIAKHSITYLNCYEYFDVDIITIINYESTTTFFLYLIQMSNSSLGKTVVS
jgi:hypothetical protein